MEIVGILYKVLPIIEGNNNFKKKEFVIKTEEQYPQFLKFTLFEKDFKLLDNFVIGNELLIRFNLRGFEWNNQNNEKIYFNTFQVWSIKSHKKWLCSS